jgi:branched-chain amino acid transport system substrate-binding protein
MNKTTKLLGLSVVALLAAAAPVMAEDVKLGIVGGFTGPLAAQTPSIVASAQLVATQIAAQGGILNGGTLSYVTGDGGCNATTGAAAADKLVNTDQVVALVGPFCTGEAIGAAESVTIPGGVVLISPSASAPVFSTLADNDLAFRLTPSDALQGVKLANLLISRDIKDIAISYVNNDYGKGLADALAAAYTAAGGTVAANAAHEEGKADYRPELGGLTASKNLVILAYASGSGGVMLNQAIESGDFTTYVGADGMWTDDLLKGIDPAAIEGAIFTKPGAAAPDEYYEKYVTEAGTTFNPNEAFAPQSYDAAFLLALAIQKNGSASREGVSAALREVANAPGEVIHAGEWEKAVGLIAAGTDIDYQGLSGGAEFDANGDVDGQIVYSIVEGGKFADKGSIE